MCFFSFLHIIVNTGNRKLFFEQIRVDLKKRIPGTILKNICMTLSDVLDLAEKAFR